MNEWSAAVYAYAEGLKRLRLRGERIANTELARILALPEAQQLEALAEFLSTAYIMQAEAGGELAMQLCALKDPKMLKHAGVEVNRGKVDEFTTEIAGKLERGYQAEALRMLRNTLGAAPRVTAHGVIETASWGVNEGWARIPSGAKTCAFCTMLAGRGAAYPSQRSALLTKAGKSYHAGCDCVAIPIKTEADYPAGYDRERFELIYYAGQNRAQYTPGMSPAERLRELTRSMRETAGPLLTDGVGPGHVEINLVSERTLLPGKDLRTD